MSLPGKEKPKSRNKDPGGRIERLAEALRENLRRRKAQARSRAEGGEDPDRKGRAPAPAKD